MAFNILRVTYVLLLSTSSVQAEFQSSDFHQHKGTRGIGTVLRTLSVRSRVECASECTNQYGCNTFNLGPEDDWTRRMRCELVTRNSTAVDVSGAGADGWVMYVREGT